MTYLHLDLGDGGQHTEPVVGWGGPPQALAVLRRAIDRLPRAGDRRVVDVLRRHWADPPADPARFASP